MFGRLWVGLAIAAALFGFIAVVALFVERPGNLLMTLTVIAPYALVFVLGATLMDALLLGLRKLWRHGGGNGKT